MKLLKLLCENLFRECSMVTGHIKQYRVSLKAQNQYFTSSMKVLKNDLPNWFLKMWYI